MRRSFRRIVTAPHIELECSCIATDLASCHSSASLLNTVNYLQSYLLFFEFSFLLASSLTLVPREAPGLSALTSLSIPGRG